MRAFVAIRLEARLHPNIGFIFERALTVFTRSDITPPKVNSSFHFTVGINSKSFPGLYTP